MLPLDSIPLLVVHITSFFCLMSSRICVLRIAHAYEEKLIRMVTLLIILLMIRVYALEGIEFVPRKAEGLMDASMLFSDFWIVRRVFWDI